MRVGLIFFCFIALGACRPQYTVVRSTKDVPFSKSRIAAFWNEMEPTYSQYQEIRNIRVAVHFMDTQDSLLRIEENFLNENIQLLIHATNDKLTKNVKMLLPEGNDTEVLDSKIRLQLENDNIFYHYTDEAFLIKKGKEKNLYDQSVLDAYAYKPDSFLNVFLMPYHPAQIESGIQKFDKSGIALGTSIKIGGFLQSGEPAWNYAGLLMHELGHVLGLRHSWNTNDGCPDTPLHDNCWEDTVDSPCNRGMSNNFMDYNPHQAAITPCQIARMQSSIASLGMKANKLSEANWCERDTAQTREILDLQKWVRPIQVTGDIVIKKGGKLYLSSWLSIGSNSSIYIEKGGHLVLDGTRVYNQCGLSWNGIIKHPSGTLIINGDVQLENIKSTTSDKI